MQRLTLWSYQASINNADEISALLRNSSVPVVATEEALFRPMGMTGNLESFHFGYYDTQDIQLVAPDHPLSAGFSGAVNVSEQPQEIAWGRPGVGAVVVANMPDDASKAAIFAYEANVPMVGLTAPARRVGLFLDYGEIAYSDDAWTLFDAAVRWAAQVEEVTTNVDATR